MSFAVPPPFRAITTKLVNFTFGTVNAVTIANQEFPFPEAKVGDSVTVTVINGDARLNYSAYCDVDGRVILQVANPSATDTSVGNMNYRIVVFHF